MRDCLYTCLYVLVAVGRAVSKLDWVEDKEALRAQGLNSDALDVANDNDTCLCARESLLARRDASLDSTDFIALKRDECHLFNGRKAVGDGELWYELLIGMKKVWVLSKQVQTSPVSLCAGNQDMTVSYATGIVSQQCLRCICLQESGCRPLPCRMDVGSLSCGYFQIKEAYWTDCGTPGRDWKSCASDITCASQCVQNYMKRYAAYYGCPLDCEGFAREHNGGPRGCKNSATLRYWQQVQNQPGCKGVHLYKNRR